MASAKKLELTFTLENGGTMDVNISVPKDGLDLATVETAAAGVTPVLENSAGSAASAFLSARYVTTTTEELA